MCVHVVISREVCLFVTSYYKLGRIYIISNMMKRTHYI